MKTSDAGGWAQVQRVAVESGSKYNTNSVDTGRLWAEAMEPRLDTGESMVDIEQECFDAVTLGLTLFQLNWVVQMLNAVWVHGPELSAIYNTGGG